MLNYSIETSTDRVQEVHKILDSTSKPPSLATLTQLADYILYGKDADGTSAVDRGEVQIRTAHNSYSRKEPVSLEELTESPTFDEQTLHPLQRSTYTNPKPVLDKTLPELQPLEAAIEQLERALNSTTDPNRRYHLRHALIEQRRAQYDIQKLVRQPAFQFIPRSNGAGAIPELSIFPLGVKIGDSQTRFTDPLHDTSEFVPPPLSTSIDLTNLTHLSVVLDSYSNLRSQPSNTDCAYLADTIDFYSSLLDTTPERLSILRLKLLKYTNQEIQDYLIRTYNTTFNINYISTLYTKTLLPALRDAIQDHYDTWRYRTDPSMWRTCPKCGRTLLKNTTNFRKRKNTIDGLSSYCASCLRRKKPY